MCYRLVRRGHRVRGAIEAMMMQRRQMHTRRGTGPLAPTTVRDAWRLFCERTRPKIQRPSAKRRRQYEFGGGTRSSGTTCLYVNGRESVVFLFVYR